MSQLDAYALLAEPVQKALWKLGWEKLRPIQNEAIEILTYSQNDLIISARTASGKTEAAFLPILSIMCQNPASSVQAVYVGPLKALINDQFRRLEELCEYTHIPVHRWHGDVSASKKQKFMSNPRGVLLITPESIESLFINRSTELKSLFHSLSFVVIDEIHALQGTERGTHLRSLLFRIDHHVINSPRIVGLSATIGDEKLSAEWVRPSAPDQVKLIKDGHLKKTIQYGIFAYHPREDETDQEIQESESQTCEEISADLYNSFSTGKNLIFANSRDDVEWYTDELNSLSAKEGRPDQFLIHHGALSRDIREHTETLMQGKSPFSTVCSATLELGIDIGNVRAVGQIGCPWSVNSLVQRLGRSGREENQPQIMRVFLPENNFSRSQHLTDQLHPSLIQSIALTELMLEPWVEPCDPNSGDLSTLVQQILSVIAETGGIKAADLFNRLVETGAFRQIDQSIFIEVLRQIGNKDLIEQTEPGELILGLKGEKIVRSYDFYSAFASPPEFRVVNQGQAIGMLPTTFLPSENQHFLLAGKRWQVIAIDYDRREVGVIPARGRKRPRFNSFGSKIHQKVRQKMRQVLAENKQFGYLNPSARELLEQARTTYKNAGLTHNNLIALSPSKCLWFTWTGTDAHETINAILEKYKLKHMNCEVAIELDLPLSQAIEFFTKIASIQHDPLVLARLVQDKYRRKYDEYLSDQLLEWSIAQDLINVEGACQEIDKLIKNFR
ncbi:DEAD/DEAH box helicase [Gimesia sp.]|uniref:DEAD/DEAH box helicase n=1 Tax=Gimesia sp. TaxID=2024833 RepID=UPI003A9161BF